MSPAREVVVAGGGIAASATAIRLRHLGFGVRLLVRPGAGPAGVEAMPSRALGLLDILGEPQLVAEAGGVAVAAGPGPPLVHVGRRSLARAFLDRAQARGALLVEVGRLPARSVLASSAAAVVDATGRAAAWSRPLRTDGRDVAWQFEGPPHDDAALRVVQGDGWWAYRLGTAATTWAGVVGPGALGDSTEPALRLLGLDPGEMAPQGRRAARVQRAVRTVDETRIAVGDAALAYDPIAGGGIRFALASAVAAATVIATWVEDPERYGAAAAYYEQLVSSEHARHLAARRAIVAGLGEATLAEPEPVADHLRFAAMVVEAPLAVDGRIQTGAAVLLPDGTLTRWLGSFDLLVLARLAAEQTPRLVLLAQLQQEGLGATAARAVLSWAARHGVLSAGQGPRPGSPGRSPAPGDNPSRQM